MDHGVISNNIPPTEKQKQALRISFIMSIYAKITAIDHVTKPLTVLPSVGVFKTVNEIQRRFLTWGPKRHR